MATYGRHRQSIADIENELQIIFNKHPNSQINHSGEPVIPADALVDVFRSFSDGNGTALLSDDELELLKALLASNPGLEVTPQILLQFIAERTKSSPQLSPNFENDILLPGRGRAEEREDHVHSRSSSSESNNAYYRSTGSRASSRGPQTPGYPKSPLDAERRQRSTPLANNAPSSWAKRPAPASRRKSDAGSRSDSESSVGPGAFNANGQGGRRRTPSNPTSPSSTALGLDSFSPIGSPTFGARSRPHSRARSQPQATFMDNSFGFHFGSPGEDHGYISPDDNTINSNYTFHHDDSFSNEVNSLLMPRESSPDFDEDEQEGLVLDRTKTDSTVSMEPMDRLDVLQRANTELGRKLMEAERTLQNKLSEHELELEEMQGRLEEMKTELSATKREEKELRSKERQNITQIGALELEVSKVSKALEHARATYTSLQRQYQEQCAASEKYRDDLRLREELIRSLREAATLHEVETGKWAKEQQSYEDRIAHLEQELDTAEQAHAQLDEQKQENLLLKETIDRMRFDMDEMRSAAAPSLAANSGTSSASNTISKSLGAELLGKMNAWGLDNDVEGDDDEGSSGTAVDLEMDDDDTESEDVIQTIITRKRKVASRANKLESRTFEELREYSDTATQTSPEAEVPTASFSVQTDDPPTRIFAIQTDPEPVPPLRLTLEMEIQTDVIEDEISRSPSPQHTESMASSSSTIIPPTPKANPQHIDVPVDQPPAYNQIGTPDDWRVADTLQKWHRGVKVPFEPIAGGISQEAVDEWKALKDELGVECEVIDKIIDSSRKSGSPRSLKNAKSTSRGRFYNIYNTYVYGDKSPSIFPAGLAGQAVMFMGASALLLIAVSPYMIPQYSVPGGPTYYDRSAWHSFNTMQAAGEGFGPDSTAAVWNFLGRVGGGAARIARGWPT